MTGRMPTCGPARAGAPRPGAATAEAPHLAVMMAAAEQEWQRNAPSNWTGIDFWRWPRGFHRSTWVAAGYIGWNPLDALDRPTPAARAVNALLTRHCLVLAVAMTGRVLNPRNPVEPLLSWFNAAVREHQHDIAAAVEAAGNARLNLPASRLPLPGRAPTRRHVGQGRRSRIRRPVRIPRAQAHLAVTMARWPNMHTLAGTGP